MTVKLSKPLIYLTALTSIAFWGLSYIWCDRILALGIPVEFFLPFRIFLAGLVLVVINFVFRIDMRIRKQDWVTFLLLALCEPFIYFFCETYGIQFTESPTISALVIATTPIVAMGAGYLFFKESVSLQSILGIIVCLGGLVLVSEARPATSGRLFIFGILVLLLAVFAEVGHASCTKSLAEASYPPTVIVMYQFLIGSVYFLPMLLTRGMENYDPEVYLSSEFFSSLLKLSILCSCVAFSLWAIAIKHLGVGKSSIFLAMIPVATALWGFILGDEILHPLQWVGLGIAVAGLVMTQLTSRKDSGCKSSGCKDSGR